MPAINRCARMDCPTWISVEFGRRFFRIKLPDFQSARPAEDGLHSTIVDIFVPRLFCCFVDRASRPLRDLCPGRTLFCEVSAQIVRSGSRAAAPRKTGDPRQFNDGEEQRQTLLSSARPPESLYSSLRQVVRRRDMKHSGRIVAASHNQIRTEIVTTYEQLLHAYAIRSICFMEEHGVLAQHEFDGNDYQATHVIVYSGDEPIGTLRIRWFKAFAKFERTSFRKDYRNIHTLRTAADFAFDHVARKGYDKVIT